MNNSLMMRAIGFVGAGILFTSPVLGTSNFNYEIARGSSDFACTLKVLGISPSDILYHDKIEDVNGDGYSDYRVIFRDSSQEGNGVLYQVLVVIFIIRVRGKR